jgi:hypothetical protein
MCPCANCTSRRREAAVQKVATDFEDQIYLPGSFNYLDQVGFTNQGLLSTDPLHQKYQNRVHMKHVFEQYCEDNLEIENSHDYQDFNGTLHFGYFLRVYKTVFFWKKLRFAK